MEWSASEILEECTSSQKYLMNLYNTAASEAANSRLRSQLLQILSNQHELHSDLFRVMERRGLYQFHPARARDIAQAEQKYPAHT